MISSLKNADILPSEGLADPWGVRNGQVDYRVNARRWQKLKDAFPDCKVVIDNVETFVQKAEKEMFNVTVSAMWFEAYVSNGII